MTELFEIALDNFNVLGKTVDSWYSSNKFLGVNYITGLKGNRKVSLVNMGKMTNRNHDVFYTTNEILETTFIIRERDLDILSDFPLYTKIDNYFSGFNNL